MRPDTPLDEVALHLPAEAAAVLSDASSDVQVATLTQVRAAVVYWETNRYVFNPVAYEGILTALVVIVVPLVGRVMQQDMDMAGMRVLVDQLIAQQQTRGEQESS